MFYYRIEIRFASKHEIKKLPKVLEILVDMLKSTGISVTYFDIREEK